MVLGIVCINFIISNKIYTENIFPNLGLYTLAGWLLAYNVFNLQNINKESSHKMRASIASIGLCGISLIAIYIGLVAPDKIFLLLQLIHSLDILVFDIHNTKERLIFILGSLLSVLLMHNMPFNTADVLLIKIILMLLIGYLYIKHDIPIKPCIPRILIASFFLSALSDDFGFNKQYLGLILIIVSCVDIFVSCFISCIQTNKTEQSPKISEDMMLVAISGGWRKIIGILVMIIIETLISGEIAIALIAIILILMMAIIWIDKTKKSLRQLIIAIGINVVTMQILTVVVMWSVVLFFTAIAAGIVLPIIIVMIASGMIAKKTATINDIGKIANYGAMMLIIITPTIGMALGIILGGILAIITIKKIDNIYFYIDKINILSLN